MRLQSGEFADQFITEMHSNHSLVTITFGMAVLKCKNKKKISTNGQNFYVTQHQNQ